MRSFRHGFPTVGIKPRPLSIPTTRSRSHSEGGGVPMCRTERKGSVRERGGKQNWVSPCSCCIYVRLNCIPVQSAQWRCWSRWQDSQLLNRPMPSYAADTTPLTHGTAVQILIHFLFSFVGLVLFCLSDCSPLLLLLGFGWIDVTTFH